MKRKFFINFIALVSVLFLANSIFAQTTTFTHQSKLNDGAIAANGAPLFRARLVNTDLPICRRAKLTFSAKARKSE